ASHLFLPHPPPPPLPTPPLHDALPIYQGYGVHLTGGHHARIEAPYIMSSEESGYYYLLLTFGGLDADGGYNVRIEPAEGQQQVRSEEHTSELQSRFDLVCRRLLQEQKQ